MIRTNFTLARRGEMGGRAHDPLTVSQPRGRSRAPGPARPHQRGRVRLVSRFSVRNQLTEWLASPRRTAGARRRVSCRLGWSWVPPLFTRAATPVPRRDTGCEWISGAECFRWRFCRRTNAIVGFPPQSTASRASTASSTCSSVTVSGGSKRITLGVEVVVGRAPAKMQLNLAPRPRPRKTAIGLRRGEARSRAARRHT
jgi:hypothetical protein